ncbi:DUF4282 domain-containing protein [Corynebacterium sp. ED61]|uniref:DUF4282 domain-containing protein n=1 Tax=Corynebacterium sp. ED61 TaxID=2211360 RepID=UPI001883CCF3|nr:DUF4282 domain-containing protein [Corynebacterium sp. ED61]MBF0580829.1 DUF4282 domain-containing protein [Corynebacterium sp. ED61]
MTTPQDPNNSDSNPESNSASNSEFNGSNDSTGSTGYGSHAAGSSFGSSQDNQDHTTQFGANDQTQQFGQDQQFGGYDQTQQFGQDQQFNQNQQFGQDQQSGGYGQTQQYGQDQQYGAYGQNQAAFGAYPQQQAPIAGAKKDSFFSALFDLSFTKYATPSVAKTVYIISMVVISLYTLFGIIACLALLADGGAEAVFGLIFGVPIVLLLGLTMLALFRVSLEVSVAQIRTSEAAMSMNNRLAQSNTQAPATNDPFGGYNNQSF